MFLLFRYVHLCVTCQWYSLQICCRWGCRKR